MRYALILTLIAALGLPGDLLFAGEAEGNGRGDAGKEEAKPAAPAVTEEEEEEAAEKEEQEDDAEPRLGRTVRLLFKMVPEDNPNQRLSVLCAARRYALHISFATPDGNMEFDIGGEVKPVANEGEEDANKFFMTFDVHLEASGPEGKFGVGTEGSATVRFGEQTVLAELGEKTLCVTLGAPLLKPRPLAPPEPAPPPKAPKEGEAPKF